MLLALTLSSVAAAVAFDAECLACMAVFGALENFGNQSTSQLLKEIDVLCDRIPVQSVRNDCMKIASTISE